MSVENTRRQRDIKLICEYMSGESIDSIVNKAGISTSTLYSILRDNNIRLKLKDKAASDYFRRTIFQDFVSRKKTFDEIARDTGIPLDVVNAYARFVIANLEAERAKGKLKSKTAKTTAARPVSKPGVSNKGVAESKKVKSLGKDGLIGQLPYSDDRGLNISQTVEERSKRDSIDEVEEEVKEEKLVDMFGDDWSDEEALQLELLRGLLLYASKVTSLPDYSKDNLLVPNLVFPVDIVIMKDITARSLSGESVESIAATHRTDVSLVSDLLSGKVDRDAFRDKFINSLVNRGLIQL